MKTPKAAVHIHDFGVNDTTVHSDTSKSFIKQTVKREVTICTENLCKDRTTLLTN